MYSKTTYSQIGVLFIRNVIFLHFFKWKDNVIYIRKWIRRYIYYIIIILYLLLFFALIYSLFSRSLKNYNHIRETFMVSTNEYNCFYIQVLQIIPFGKNEFVGCFKRWMKIIFSSENISGREKWKVNILRLTLSRRRDNYAENSCKPNTYNGT